MSSGSIIVISGFFPNKVLYSFEFESMLFDVVKDKLLSLGLGSACIEIESFAVKIYLPLR